MTYRIKLYAYDPRYCACHEQEVFLNFNPEGREKKKDWKEVIKKWFVLNVEQRILGNFL